MSNTTQSNSDHTKPRDRRKLRLQAEVRRQAFRLFARQGYAKTSVEQIAAAADISYSTFFRHFPSKQAIAGDLRFDALFIDAFESQPNDISLSQAISAATAALPDLLSSQDIAEMREHYTILMKVPELQATGFAYLNATAHEVAQLITARVGAATSALSIEALAWSVVASWVAAFHYWIAHPESELFSVVEEAVEGVLPQADRLTGLLQT